MNNTPLIVRQLGLQPYEPTWQAMQAYTQQRGEQDPDQFWCLQHQPVFTQGQAGKAEHILNPGDIPVIQVDRGGQVTYHGPGQLVVYFLIELRRQKLAVRGLVSAIEQSVIKLLADYGITAASRCDAPGVYVDDAKICSLGLRIRRGCSFHGLALNVDMDLEPFRRINPCGLKNMRMIQIKDLYSDCDMEQVTSHLLSHLYEALNYQANNISQSTAAWQQAHEVNND